MYYTLFSILFSDYTSNVVGNDDSALRVDSSLLDESDFNCVLCCGIFRNPVTTPCGHTYCMDCLEHSFDYSFHCPLCFTSLPPVSINRRLGIRITTYKYHLRSRRIRSYPLQLRKSYRMSRRGFIRCAICGSNEDVQILQYFFFP